ncbi:hypothetical protein ACFL40_05880 [candidate division KSB1 bacterium]
MRRRQNMVPKHIKAILEFKSKISKKLGREISFSEALAYWFAYPYESQFMEDNYF